MSRPVMKGDQLRAHGAALMAIALALTECFDCWTPLEEMVFTGFHGVTTRPHQWARPGVPVRVESRHQVWDVTSWWRYCPSCGRLHAYWTFGTDEAA